MENREQKYVFTRYYRKDHLFSTSVGNQLLSLALHSSSELDQVLPSLHSEKAVTYFMISAREHFK